ncbi:PREDICTED: uncharacterized protein LOC109212653 [Nicotiana attenuata]|uniref:uncharacterized protein LOC109212653 n=1 Tax=Nicotiana attenuata TaxID=49451 RepID=UPI0009052D37|nr:PREDICTED: uncharacterized protein LOC109212653 [Nicotiana attenuata]
MSKTGKEYTDADRKAVEKNFHAKKILVCGIGPEEYNRISACDTAKEIWEALQTAHEGTTQVKQSKIDVLTIENKLVRKILSILPSPWESKVNTITESKDLQELTIEELVGNLKTYEMKRKIDSGRREPEKEKNLVLKADSNDSSEEDSDMDYLTKRFQKMVRRNGEMLKRGSSSKPKNYDLCHKCGKPGHFIKDCPLLKQEFSKNKSKKAAKRNTVPLKDFKRKRSADNVVKQALAAWGDSSGESEDETDAGDSSMMAVEGEENEYDSTFALMAQSDDDEDDDNKEETIENLKEERNDFLAVIADLRETIERPGTKSKPGNSGKGKEIASEEHIRLENELKAARTRICVETEKNKHLQTDKE